MSGLLHIVKQELDRLKGAYDHTLDDYMILLSKSIRRFNRY